MSIDLSDNNPRVEYSVAEGVTQTSFAIPFEFFDDSDVNIYVDGVLKTEGVDYTLSGGDGSTGTATISVTGGTGGSTVIVVRRIALERVTDFTAGADINRAALNQQLDSLVAIAADLDDRIDRAIHIPDSDPADITFELPVKADRASKYLAFGVDGDVVMTSGATSEYIVSTFAETFLDDANGAAVLNTLGVTSTPAELNILDGVTSNASELNLLDGKTLSGSDAVIITGTVGTSGQVAQWNADGDVVGYTIPTQIQATWETGTDTTESLVSAAKVKAAIDDQVPALLNAFGSAPVYACRAWVNFNGIGTVAIRASGNVSSITDNGAGNYTVNFTTAMPDANYAVSGSSGDSSPPSAALCVFGTPAAGSVQIALKNHFNNTLVDTSQVHVVVHR